MARQVLPIVGAVIGAFYGNPQAGYVIGSLIGNAVDPQVIKGPSLGDGQTQTSKEGVVRPIIYGTASCAGNIIATGPLIKKKEKQGGGKGGPVTEVEKFYRTYAIRVCEGPVNGLIRIWEDETLVYDVRNEGSQVTPKENDKYSKKFVFYYGDEQQLPDSALEGIFGVGNTPAYRGSAYIVYENADLTNRYGSVPNYRFEVTVSDTATSPGFLTNAVTFEGKPGTYKGYQSISAMTGPNYNDCIAMTVDQKFIFVARSSSYGIRVLKLNEETLNYEVFQDLPTYYGANSGFIISSDQRFLYTYCYQPSGVNNPIGSFMVSFLITENGLNEVDRIQVDREPQGDFGQRISVNSQESKIVLKSVVDGVPGQVSAGLDVIHFDKTTGKFTGISRKGDAEYPHNASTAQGQYIRFLPNSNFILMSRLFTYWVYDATTFELLSIKNFFTFAGYSAKQHIWQDTSKLYHVFEFSGSSTTSYLNFHFTIGINGVISDTVDNNWVPINYPQSVNYAAISTADTNNCEFLFYGAASTGISFDKPGFYIYKKNSLNKFDIIQVKTKNEINSEIVVGTGGYTSGSPLFSGNSNIIAVTGKYYLSSIIRDISDRCGLSLSDINTTQIDGVEVRGFVLAQQFTAKAAISSLQQCFFFDTSEYDDKINFIARGADVTEIFEDKDFVDDPYEANRKSTIEYPKKLNLIYQNAKIGYDTAKAEARRNSPNVNVSGEKTFELPVVFIEDEAAQTADKQMKIAWAEAAGDYKFSLPTQYDYLVPSDVFGVYLNNNSQRMRIEKIDRADGILNITAKIDRQSAYTSNVTAMPLPEPTPPPPTITGTTVFEYLNIPALLDSNDVLGYYIAAGGQTQAWRGATIQRKHDGVSEDFQNVETVTGLNVIGHLLEDVADASADYSDTTNVIHLQLYDSEGSFEAVSQDTLLRENNAIAIVNGDGTAEIIQFRDVESIGNGEYKLSYLLRGRLNTTTYSHASGKNVVWLRNAQLIVTDAMEIGTTFVHRPVSFGQEVEDAPTFTNEFDPPYIQVEWPVDLLRGTLVSNVLDIEWSPRERFGSDIIPVRSVNWERYEVDVTDGTTTKTFQTTNPELTETLSGFTGTITATVYQVNRFTGRGPGVSISF